MLQAVETMGEIVLDQNNWREDRRRARDARRAKRYRRLKRQRRRDAKRDASKPSFVTDYPGLIKAIVRRRQALGLRQLAMDERAGLPDGYQGKLECGMRHLGPISLPLVLGALGLRLMVVPTDDRPMIVPKVRRARTKKRRI